MDTYNDKNVMIICVNIPKKINGVFRPNCFHLSMNTDEEKVNDQQIYTQPGYEDYEYSEPDEDYTDEDDCYETDEEKYDDMNVDMKNNIEEYSDEDDTYIESDIDEPIITRKNTVTNETIIDLYPCIVTGC